MTNQSFRFQDFYDPQPYEPQPPAPAQAAPAQPAAEPAPAVQQAYPQTPAQPAQIPQAQQPELSWQSGPIVSPGAWTGMQRFGWLLAGALGGIFGVLVASMCNVGHPYRSEATKMAVIGLVIAIALSALAGFGAAMAITASTLTMADAAGMLGA